MPRARKAPVDLLDAALTALDRGQRSEFAELAREAWRETRAPELARSYSVLLDELRGPALAGRDAVERAASWRARAIKNPGDPLELPVLLAEPWMADADELERLRLLEAWSPDPLLAEVLARRLRIPASPPAIAGTNELLRRTIELLDAQRDPRQLSILDWLRAEPVPADIRGQIRRAHAHLVELRPTPLSAPQREAAAKLARRAEPRRAYRTNSSELLAAVFAAPDDDEPRLVYADWLATHGDPRGEFISLQVERARSGAAISTRELELLDRHGPEWAGSLHGVLGASGRVFERGFLAAGSVEVGPQAGEVAELPDWSTLRSLDGHVSDALARRGALDHLRELYGFLQLDRFVALRADNRLARVESYECSLADPNLSFDTPLGLRSLLVRRALDDALVALADSSALAGLEQLGVYYSSNHSYAADHRERRSLAHRVELLRERLGAHVRRLRLIDDSTPRASRPCGWVLTFERDELERFSWLRVDWFQPVHERPSARRSALPELRELLDELVHMGLRGITLGKFEDPTRPMALAYLRELL